MKKLELAQINLMLMILMSILPTLLIGGPLGELQYETFSAAGAELIFHGRNVHP